MYARASIVCRLLLPAVGFTTLLLAGVRPVQADDKASPTGGYFGTFEGHYLDNIGEKTTWAVLSNPPVTLANFNVLPKWGGGGRVGLGYRAEAGWDAVVLGDADWLYSGHQQLALNGGSTQVFTSTLAPAFGSVPLLPGTTVQASADAQLAYSYVDLEGGYNLRFGTIFDARFFGGVRYANFDQTTQTSSLDFSFPAFQSDTRREVSYWGVGPRIGGSSRLRICSSPFYLVTTVSGSVLFGDMRVRDHESLSKGAAINNFNLQNTMYTSRAAYNGEGEMGVLYDISPVLQGLDVTIGYRLAGWFGVNDSRPANPTFPSGESHANVVTQGTFLRINVRY